MKLLAIETVTECCSVALLVGNEVFAISEVAPRRHNEIILPMCEQVLAQAEVGLTQLDAIAFGRGPGAFTGVRLAASVTQGIALAQDLPVVPVSSLAVLAQAAYHTHQASQVLSCIDARMQEIYYALFNVNEHEIMQVVDEEHVIKPSLMKIDVNENCFGVGSGWQSYADVLLKRCGKNILYAADAQPQAEFVARLGKHHFQQGLSVSAVEALPVYVRDKVADKPKSKTVLPGTGD